MNRSLRKGHVMRRLFWNDKQTGAVAIIFALALVSVFGFMGLALDLSQTYEMKTELQNAADAAALSGAKELVGTQAGINNAVVKAKATAQSNKFKYSQAVVLQDTNINFGDSPDTLNWQTISQAQAAPTGLLFIRINTGLQVQNIVNFMKIAGVATAPSTFGQAIAGRFSLGITPIAVCALNTVKYGQLPHSPLPSELTEFGYRRGLSYDILNINPLGAAANKFLLNPVDIATSSSDNSCNPNNSSTTAVRPYVCAGTASLITSLPGYVFANTGFSTTLNSEFNSRFTSGGSCTVPPDTNIKEYTATNTTVAGAGNPSNWMTPPGVNNQGVRLTTGATNIPFTPPSTNASDWGVLWSYNPAVQYAASPPAGGYTPYTTANWAALYPTATPVASALYPTSTTLGVPPAPYNQNSGQFFSAGTGSRDRRILNVALADYSTLQKNGQCSTLKVLGVGRFFMPVKSNLPQNLFLEFGGLIPDSALTSEIKLY